MKLRRGPLVLRAVLLALVGLLAASPFLTKHGIGTGESYNYSLAVADGVTQLRAGVFPVLVGQTEFAFNGRVHPVRDAPYLVYLAGVLDLLTGRRLEFWMLQNLSLALSLVAAVYAAYAALRWGTRCPPWTACGLAAVYGLSTSLLGAAYSFDLYMTVHVAPFVPLAFAAVARSAGGQRPVNDVALAVALAAAWWAHPPVAAWVTLTAVPLRLLLWATRPSGRALAGLLAAGALGAALTAFVFISAIEVFRYGDLVRSPVQAHLGLARLMVTQVRNAFPRSLLPVSWHAGQLGDLQLGYIPGLLLVAVVAVAARDRMLADRVRLTALGLAGIGALLAIMCLPAPGLTAWLWRQVPYLLGALTNDWPMQRLYLVATAATVIAAGLALPRAAGAGARRRPRLAALLAVLAILWTLGQAAPFVARGFRDRWSAQDTARAYAPSNLDLTVTSYAFIGLPPTFAYGVVEPWAEFRLLDHHGRDALTGNYATALADSPVVAHGVLRRSAMLTAVSARYDPALTLDPGRHYLLGLKWRAAPFTGILNFHGPTLQRTYLLPSGGAAEGFGMEPGQRTALAVSTSQPAPESVHLEILADDWAKQAKSLQTPADFKLQLVDDAKLPVRVRSWLPLRADVTAPTDDCYVETPRRFIPGYVAIVNGRRTRPVVSPTGQVMLSVPAGESRIELRYEGTFRARLSFWIGVAAWLGTAALLGIRAVWPAALRRAGAGARWVLHRPLIPTGGLMVLAAMGWARGWLRPVPHPDAGPLAVRFLLPQGLTMRQQPLVVAGRRGAGNFVFLAYADADHVRVGLDVWGTLRMSDPIPVDYNQEQRVSVSAGMLYPLTSPLVAALPPWEQTRLRREIRVEFNGRTVLAEDGLTFEATPAEVTIGESRIGGSSVEPRFQGQILQVERLPIPRTIPLSSRPARFRLVLPDNLEGASEPLLTDWDSRERRSLFYLTYLANHRVLLGYRSFDGRRIESPPVAAAIGRLHMLDLRTNGHDWELDLDGFAALRLPGRGLAPGRVRLGLLGVNEADFAAIDARFTGPRLEWVTGAPAPAPWSATSARPVGLILIFPPDRMNAVEPLVVSGKTGRADLIDVAYIDHRHIRLGYDHWGVGGPVSGPIAVDYSAPHELELALGPPDSGRRRHVTARLDGVQVWQCDGLAYPPGPADLAVGENVIGASSCSPQFTGDILEVDRE